MLTYRRTHKRGTQRRYIRLTPNDIITKRAVVLMLKISLKLKPLQFYVYLRIKIKKVVFRLELTNIKHNKQN